MGCIVTLAQFYANNRGKTLGTFNGTFKGECFPEGVLVTMADGTYKDISKLRVGDEVFDATGENELVVEDAIRRDKVIYQVKTPFGVVETTEEHPFLTRSGYREVNRLTTEDEVFMPFIIPRDDTGLSDDELRWFGFWLGDGSLIKRPKEWGYRLTVSGDKHTYVDGLSVSVYQQKHSTSDITDEYRLSKAAHPLLASCLRQGYDCESQKQLPNIFTPRELNLILEGYFRADGYKSSLGIEVSSTSFKLLSAVQHACYLVGYMPGAIVEHTRKSLPVIHGVEVKTMKTCYRLQIALHHERKPRHRVIVDHGVWGRVLNVINTNEVKPVYNIQTSGEHTFIANNLAVHNCVSLAIQYLMQVYGVRVTSGHGNAVDFQPSGSGGKWLKSLGWEWLPAGTPAKDGDILVWGNDPGAWTDIYGHIAIWYKGEIFNQNFVGNRTAHLVPMFYQGYIGKWRKAAPKPKPTTPQGGDMKTDLTPAQWQEFITKVYKGFAGRTPSASEVSFHMKNSNPLSFVNGFASYKWQDDEKTIKSLSSQVAADEKTINTLQDQLKSGVTVPSGTDYSKENNTILKSIQALLSKIFK